MKNQSQDELRQLYQEIRNEENYTLRDFCGTIQWSCNQMDAKRAYAMSMLPIFTSSGNSSKSDEIQKNLQGKEVRHDGNTSACTPRREVGSGGMVSYSMGQQERLVIPSWFPYRRDDNANLARWDDLV